LRPDILADKLCKIDRRGGGNKTGEFEYWVERIIYICREDEKNEPDEKIKTIKGVYIHPNLGVFVHFWCTYK
jgi:hypothetical protein